MDINLAPECSSTMNLDMVLTSSMLIVPNINKASGSSIGLAHEDGLRVAAQATDIHMV